MSQIPRDPTVSLSQIGIPLETDAALLEKGHILSSPKGLPVRDQGLTAQHTHGPLTVAPLQYDHGATLAILANGRVIATIPYDPDIQTEDEPNYYSVVRHPDEEPNAHLLAASTEMLAFTQAAAGIIAWARVRGADMEALLGLEEMRQLAIDKAIGQVVNEPVGTKGPSEKERRVATRELLEQKVIFRVWNRAGAPEYQASVELAIGDIEPDQRSVFIQQVRDSLADTFSRLLSRRADGKLPAVRVEESEFEAVKNWHREHMAWKEAGADAEVLAAIRKAGGYAAVVADGQAQLGLGEALSHCMQARIVTVRNVLLESGWTGPPYGQLRKEVGDLKWAFDHHIERVGAGGQIARVSYTVLDASLPGSQQRTEPLFRVADEMTGSAADMASNIHNWIVWRLSAPDIRADECAVGESDDPTPSI